MALLDVIYLEEEDYVDLTSEEEEEQQQQAEEQQTEEQQEEDQEQQEEEQQGGTVATSLSIEEPEQAITTSLSMRMTEVIERGGHQTTALLTPPPMSTELPFPRQFWKAGDDKFPAQSTMNVCPGGQNRLRIHPKFLHSNATSHKWAFGAIAELLDNAVDEVQTGATFVKIDKMRYSSLGEYSLLVQDDGGGMSPENLRRSMGFGFSNKCTSSIGQYGNGLKTSTMRLGADAMVFTCRQDNSKLTRSVGLLSYTFLIRNSCVDVFVPVVDYEFDVSSCTFKRIMDHGEKHFSSNLYTLLKWSPFSTEEDLLNEFEDIGHHGTKIVIFNLWFNDAHEMELDFTTDDEDIMLSGAPAIPDEHRKIARLNHMHIANRFRYSLRIYVSILYLHLPKHFEVILCGRIVETHHIVSDLIYCECIRYRPNVGGSTEANIITKIGFLKGAPKLDVYGFNVYHGNRLILPFWPAGSEKARGRGIAGVVELEANFIRPTHDKQDFEKTTLFYRLETRLKDMTTEYWKIHGYRVGYTRIVTAKNIAGSSRDEASVKNLGSTSGPLQFGVSMNQKDHGACTSMSTSLCTLRNASPQTEPYKRRNACSVIDWRSQKRRNTNDYANQPGDINVSEMGDERSTALIIENQVLKSECPLLEAVLEQLQLKADSLRKELSEWRKVHADLTLELEFYKGLKALRT